MQQKLFFAALLGSTALPSISYADDSLSDEIVITASRLPQSLNQTIADTTVLTEQDIRNSGATDVATMLRMLPGVEVVQTGGLGAQASVFMRGTNSNQVLVLLDGVRINSATLGTTGIEHLMLDDIERIEVVRGNVSSLYGSEAMGGVIQIFTKHGSGKPTFSASTGIGNLGTRHLDAGFSGAVDGNSFSVNAGHVESSNVSAMNPQLVPGVNPNNNGYANDTFNANMRHAFSADHALSASVFSTRGNISYDNPFNAAVTDVNNIVENIDKYSLASEDRLNDAWNSKIMLAEGTDDSHTYLNGQLQSRYQTKNDQLSWQNNFAIAKGQQISLSAEHLRQGVNSTVLFTQTSRTVNSLLGGYVGNFGAQEVQLNLRQDRYSDFGTANTGLLGYGIGFATHWRATANISNAFKAPTFDDMYWPFAFGYQGNPNLQPERSVNREAGLHYDAGNQHVNAIYFDNRIGNLILLNAAYTTVVNISKAQIKGQELSYSGDFGHSHLKADLTFQNPVNSITGQVLPRRAKEFSSFSASRDFNSLNLGAEFRYSGSRPDINPVTYAPVTLSSYSLLNLVSRYTIDKHFNIEARIDNLFNRNYSEAYGFNTLGRVIFVGLNYTQ